MLRLSNLSIINVSIEQNIPAIYYILLYSSLVIYSVLNGKPTHPLKMILEQLV